MRKKAANWPVMNNKYTHIFFDLDNTLWDFERNSRNAMFVAFHQFKLEIVADFNLFFESYTRHNLALWESYRRNALVKKDLTRLRFQNTFTELDIKGVDANEMNTLYLKEMPKQKVLNDGVIEVLNYLKKKQYNLNIITNGFKEVQHEKIKTSGLKPYFDKIFISEEIKSPKPERGIFEYSIKSSNARKAKSIMIGDDWDVDVMGAVNYGIHAVHFKKGLESSIKLLENPLKNACNIYSIDAISQLEFIL
jgi:putative hydrolase of the HAD superfamily